MIKQEAKMLTSGIRWAVRAELERGGNPKLIQEADENSWQCFLAAFPDKSLRYVYSEDEQDLKNYVRDKNGHFVKKGNLKKKPMKKRRNK